MRTSADKYWFIVDHVKFLNKDYEGAKLEFEVHNVCPMTNRIEKYEALNTTPQIWVEVYTPWYDEGNKNWIRCHDWEVDSGGYTMDEAIDDVYQKVLAKYGDYTKEEYDAKWEEVYNPNNSLTNSSILQQLSGSIWEDKHPYAEDRLSEREQVAYIEELGTLKNTLTALKTFKLSAPEDKHKEIDRQILNTEHDIWVHELTLHWGIDYT